MRQFKATQITPQQGPLSLYVRLVGKFIFMKGQETSKQYVDNIITQMENNGAVIVKGNGGWIRIDIIRDVPLVKLGDLQIEQSKMDDGQIEDILFEFYVKKYKEAKFVIQEIVE